MNSSVENRAGPSGMTDQVITSDLLMAAKTGVRNYAIAITECASPNVRTVLTRHLVDAIGTHERIFDYMNEKGWYHAYDIPKQIQLDIQSAERTLNLPS